MQFSIQLQSLTISSHAIPLIVSYIPRMLILNFEQNTRTNKTYIFIIIFDSTINTAERAKYLDCAQIQQLAAPKPLQIVQNSRK